MSSRMYYFIFTRRIAIFVRDSARYECQVTRIRNVDDTAETYIDPTSYRISSLYVLLCSIRSLLSWFQIFRSLTSIFDLTSGTKVEIDDLRKSEYRQPIPSLSSGGSMLDSFLSFSFCLFLSLQHEEYKFFRLHSSLFSVSIKCGISFKKKKTGLCILCD